MKYKYNNEWKDLKIKASDTVAIGTIVPFGGNVAPTNWLICDGSAVSRTTYASLFAVIGTSFGEGDGSTTFNLPDFRDRTPVGVNASGNHFKTIGSKYVFMEVKFLDSKFIVRNIKLPVCIVAKEPPRKR